MKRVGGKRLHCKYISILYNSAGNIKMQGTYFFQDLAVDMFKIELLVHVHVMMI